MCDTLPNELFEHILSYVSVDTMFLNRIRALLNLPGNKCRDRFEMGENDSRR